MVNLGNPDAAFHTALLPGDGVGLARLEFIVAEHIKAHPMALVVGTHPRMARFAAAGLHRGPRENTKPELPQRRGP